MKTINSNNLTITPNDINTSEHFWGCFGNSETETSAMWIVRLCQKNGGWYPFTEKEIEDFYNEGGYENFWFNRLLKSKDIIEKCGLYYKVYYITPSFVLKCPKL